MKFAVQYISFFVIQGEGADAASAKNYRHYQTLDEYDYEDSALQQFLDGEFARIAKRKVERNPRAEQVPTKIGRFITEPGFELESNPNYNLFARLRYAENKQDFLNVGDELLNAYLNTSAVRGGAFLVASAKLNQYFDDPFVFILKCDFEPKIARITDEKSLLNQVEMAINAKNMKSIQYPFMPEEGMLEPAELKIHQSSHARYFEDFLKYVEYEQSMPEILHHQVLGLVQEQLERDYEHKPEEREQEEKDLEIWAASEKRELQEKWTPTQVMDAANYLAQQNPDLEMRIKLDHISVKAQLADYGRKVHIARQGERYVILIEGDYLHFEKGVSPVELLRPDDLHAVIERIIREEENDR
ncbi:DUF3900 domain-containing protein [Paenibacillus alginolyticus]|uniref:DUF3900 domain-containing protein n=1 Tax=Paenibacillus alginolyticus TaxID=59839 RepID=UPI00041AD7E9|nr:DUF3900 domain-containing protein [Paenibacillus alginolyticus]MCY9665431.1 DUF3900 domain-containing protein [Paenibacillus alginolyticus]